MREIISFHFGQTGAQIATPLWQLYCLEHGINFDGTIMKESDISRNDTNRNILFSETQNGGFVPLAYIADDDYQVLNQIHSGELRKLFSNNFIQEFKGDSGSIWISSNQIAQTSEMFRNQIRKILDRCDSLQGIMIYHSVSGGFGGSYASFLLKEYEDDFQKVIKSTVSLLSSDENSTSSIVEPYNSVFTINELKKNSDLNIFVDNSALFTVCENQLDIDYANYSTLNRMIASMISSITSAQRLNSEHFLDLLDIYQNLVSLPQLQFLHSSYSPFISKDKENTQSINLTSISQALFNEQGSFIKFSPGYQQYFGVNLFFQGDCPYKELQTSINEVKSFKSIHFADWVPLNYQMALCSKRITQIPNTEFGYSKKTACLIANSSLILNPLSNIQYRFKTLHEKKCFHHWFLKKSSNCDKMEEQEFKDAFEFFNSLILNYEESISLVQDQEKQQLENQSNSQVNDTQNIVK